MTGNTDAAALGPPVAPLPFDEIVFQPARRVMAPVHVPGDDDDDNEADEAGEGDTNQKTSTSTSTSQGGAMKIPDRPSRGLQRAESMSGNVLVVLEEGNNSGDIDQAQRAYWIQRKIGKTTAGSVRIGYTLRRRNSDGKGDQWEVTPKGSSKPSSSSSTSECGNGVPAADGAAYEMVAIKMYERSKCTRNKANGPAVEIAASQHLARHVADPSFHHVLGVCDVLADDRHVYLIMPYCDGGDLLSILESRGRLEESVARHIFKQLLSALELFQSVGICHRDVSPEHVMVQGGDCYLSGKAHCLQIPYSSSSKEGQGGGSSSITDVKSGTVRRLITPQGQCGQPQYMGPVMLANTEGFDAHATDLWSAGIILFHMLFGVPPFALANNDDPRFFAISTKGQLAECAKAWFRETVEKKQGSSPNGGSSTAPSDEAIDLLQSMLMADPNDRLSLRQILSHPWVTSKDVQRLDSNDMWCRNFQ